MTIAPCCDTRRFSMAAFLVCAALSFSAAPAQETTPALETVSASPALVPIRLLPHWIPQAQFAGFYMGLEKGFYEREGIALTILRGGPDYPAGPLLTSGDVTFASMFLSQALELRDQGVPVMNIAQITQRSALMLVARKSSGIAGPNDLDGKKVSIWEGFRAQPLALFNKLGVKPVILPQTSTLNLFLRGGVDAASAMWYNEYHTLLNSGVNEDEMVVMFYDDHGLNFPEDGLYCLRKTLEDNRELCCRFTQATVDGWEYAFAHTGETIGVVMRYAEEAHTGTNWAHQRWMLARMQDLIHPPGNTEPTGHLNADDFFVAAEELKRCNVIRTIPALEDFHVACVPEN